MITMSGVTLIRDDQLILDEINLDVRPGEQWAIVGKNGSGKTTILEMLNGYMFPSSGKIQVLGYTYGSCDVREVRKQIGYISTSMLEKLNMSDPAWEVVATGEYAFLTFYRSITVSVRKKALAMLELLEVGHLANRPLGALSQGERRKVMLARALMTSPKLLIMDEPCAGLDLYQREKLLRGIASFADLRVQIVYVTHHIEEIIPMFTHVALVDEGRVAAAGPKAEVLTESLLRSVYQIPAKIEWQYDRPWLKVASGGL